MRNFKRGRVMQIDRYCHDRREKALQKRLARRARRRQEKADPENAPRVSRFGGWAS